MASARMDRLPGLPLFFCEQTIHIPRGVETNFLGEMFRIFRDVLRSKLG